MIAKEIKEPVIPIMADINNKACKSKPTPCCCIAWSKPNTLNKILITIIMAMLVAKKSKIRNMAKPSQDNVYTDVGMKHSNSILNRLYHLNND